MRDELLGLPRSVRRSTPAGLRGDTSDTITSLLAVGPPTAVSPFYPCLPDAIDVHPTTLLRHSLLRSRARHVRSTTLLHPSQICESPTLAERLQQTQAQLATLMAAIAISPTSTSAIAPATATATATAMDGLAAAHTADCHLV